MKQQSIKFLFISLLWLLASTSFAEGKKWRAPETVEGAKTVSVKQAKTLFDQSAVFIDVRNLKLYSRRHIPRAYHLELKASFNQDSLEKIAKKDQPVVIYCSGVKCSRSYRASEMAISWGYQDIRYFRTGIVGWRDAGMPMESSN